jgi:hypothetical protein
MLLSESVQLLGDQGKYFSDVYKLYEYRDDQLLKDYLDFVIHEPLEWMRGFPVKFVNKVSFSKPKTALIKLLKQSDVIDALGQAYVRRVHDIVWSTFKKHSEEIIAKRQNSVAVSVLDQLDSGSVYSEPQLHVEDVVSVHSVRKPRESVDKWEARYRVLESAYRELLADSAHSPGLTQSALRFLDALSA